MEDSRDSFSFEIDDLSMSSANSELFGSEDMDDISELLEGFETTRGDERKREDLRVSSKENETKDVKSARNSVLKDRGMLDDKMKSGESFSASRSKIPIRITNNSSSANKISGSDKEQLKRKEKMADGDKITVMKQEEMENEDATGFIPEKVTSLPRNVAVGDEENMIKKAERISSVKSRDVDDRESKQLNLDSSLHFTEEKMGKNVENCHECPRERCDQSIRTHHRKSEITEADFLLGKAESKRAKSYQDREIFSIINCVDVEQETGCMSDQNGKEKDLNAHGNVHEKTNNLLGKGEIEQVRNQEHVFPALIGIDSETMTEKKLMNKNQSDQTVKNLNGQECVKDEKNSDDIVIPSLPVDVEGSSQDFPNNRNDKRTTENYMRNSIFVKRANQEESIDFDSPPREADNEQVNKEKSNFKNCENIKECTSQEEIATPSLVHDDNQSCSDDIEKLMEKKYRRTKNNNLYEESSIPDLKQQGNVKVMRPSLVASEGSDVGKAEDTPSRLGDQKAKVSEANFVAKTVDTSLTDGEDSVGHEPNHEKRSTIQALNDENKVNQSHNGVSSTCDFGESVLAKDNDIDKFTTRDVVEFSSIAVEMEGIAEDKLYYRKDNKPKGKTWKKHYLTKTECHIGSVQCSPSLIPDYDRIVSKVSKTDDQSTEYQSERESEHFSDDIYEIQSCKDINEYENEQNEKIQDLIAESPKICLKMDRTIKSGQNFSFRKTPVPAPRKKKPKSTTAAVTSTENNVISHETIALNEELRQEFSPGISCKEKPQQKHCLNLASVEKQTTAVVKEVKETNGSLQFDDDDFKRKGLIAGRKDEYKNEQEDNALLRDDKNENENSYIVGPTEKFVQTCLDHEGTFSSEETPVVEPKKSEHFRDLATQQILHENKPKIECREEEKNERYDSENFLLPQDISAFSPPFCSTPCSQRVPSPTPEVQSAFDKEKKVFGIFSIDGEIEQQGPHELPNKREEGRVSSRENKDGEIVLETENVLKTDPLFKEGGTEDDEVFNKCIKDDVWYEDDESIYATSIVTENFENPSWCERNIVGKSPEYEEVNLYLRGVADSSVRLKDVARDTRKGGMSYYHGKRKDDIMKRREEKTIGGKINHDGPIWRTQQQSSRKEQSHKTGSLRHQSPFVQIPRGVNLDETLGTQLYGYDLLKLPCTKTNQTSSRWSESTERPYLRKPFLHRNSAFVPFESSVRGRIDYPKKHGSSKEKKWYRSTEECYKDRNCSGSMKYTSMRSCQNPAHSFQRKNDTNFATSEQNNNYTELRIGTCFDHVQHSKSKSDINFSGFLGSQIGTMHVITFPLSRGPGIAVQRVDNRRTSGIFVKEINEGGDAYQDGRLRPGDRLLTINGYNLSIASLSQAKSVLRKLKLAQSELFATIRFVRDSDDISVDDMDSSLDRSVTLPFSSDETTHIEGNTIGKQDIHHDSSYLKEELILPTPLMTSTPIDVNESTSDSSEREEPSFVNFHNLHDGLLMIPPNTKVHLNQLETSLSFLGLDLSPHQKDLLRDQLEVDSQGYVVYEDFATAARDVYSLDLSIKEPLVFPEREIKSLPDIVPRPSIDSILASRREFDKLVSEKDEIKEEVHEIKKRLSKKAKVLRNMEDELAEVRKDLEHVQNRKMILLKEERDLEKARARASINMQDYTTAISSLEQEIKNIRTSNLVPVTSQLVSICASVNKQIQNLVTRVRSVEKSNRNYRNVTQKLMAFAHKVHQLQHEGAIMSALDHTYQTVDQIHFSKSRGVNSRDRNFRNQNEFLSREARRVISTVQRILSQEPLPFGWEEAYTEKGSKFYIDHMSGVTTWQLPTSIS